MYRRVKLIAQEFAIADARTPLELTQYSVALCRPTQRQTKQTIRNCKICNRMTFKAQREIASTYQSKSRQERVSDFHKSQRLSKLKNGTNRDSFLL